MMKNHVASEITWFITHNGVDVFHYGEVEEGQWVSTGQNYLELFTDESEYNTRLSVLLGM